MRVFLCLIASLALATAMPGERLHIQVYVDQNAPGPGPGLGTLTDPFKTILDAVNYAIPHDYILVRPGVYNEAVNLPFSVWLQSLEGPAKTIIDATGQPGAYAVTSASLSEVTGFTITKQDGAGLLLQGTTPEFGRLVKGNRIIDCPNGGLHMDGPIHPAVSETVIYNCAYGVRLENGASPYLTGFTITDCTVGMEHIGAPWGTGSFFANSVIWGNTTELSGFVPGDLLNCNVADASYAGVNGCISSDPLWRAASARDYRLLANSPCIDTGHPWYTLSSSEFDNRGYGAWRRMDGDHDGTVTPDMGAMERVGLQTGQIGTGAGSIVWGEVDTGPFTEWWLAMGPFGPIPTTPLPLTGSTSFFMFLDDTQFQVIAHQWMGPSGTYLFNVLVPAWAVGQEIPVQAVGVDYSSGGAVFNFTGAELLKIQ